MELAVTGHCVGRAMCPERQFKVFHAFLFEWMKSIPSTNSICRSRRFLSRQDMSSSAFRVGIYTTLSNQECIVALVTLTVRSGDVLLMASTRDRLLRRIVKQLPEGMVCCVQVGGK